MVSVIESLHCTHKEGCVRGLQLPWYLWLHNKLPTYRIRLRVFIILKLLKYQVPNITYSNYLTTAQQIFKYRTLMFKYTPHTPKVDFCLSKYLSIDLLTSLVSHYLPTYQPSHLPNCPHNNLRIYLPTYLPTYQPKWNDRNTEYSIFKCWKAHALPS